MKNCTSIEQSKKLIELGIDVNTADMHYYKDSFGYYIEGLYNSKDLKDGCELKGIEYIPAWSLTALLSVIPQEIFDGEYIINITEGRDNRWILTYDHYENRNHSYYGLSTGSDNPVDACYEMIIKLHELNLL